MLWYLIILDQSRQPLYYALQVSIPKFQLGLKKKAQEERGALLNKRGFANFVWQPFRNTQLHIGMNTTTHAIA